MNYAKNNRGPKKIREITLARRNGLSSDYQNSMNTSETKQNKRMLANEKGKLPITEMELDVAKSILSSLDPKNSAQVNFIKNVIQDLQREYSACKSSIRILESRIV